MFKYLLCTIILSFLYSCSSAVKDYSYMNKNNYQSKPALTKSLIDSSKPLSESAIQKVLNSKVKIPKKVSLAVTRINSTHEFQRIDEVIAKDFYDTKNWGKRVQTIIPVPQVLINDPVTIEGLRRSAVLLQADMLLIVMPYSYGNWKFKWFEQNRARGTTSLEVLLLDIRTGVIPFTSIITETVEIKKDSKEYDNNELVSRARVSSEKKALIQVATQVEHFLNSAK